MRIVVNHITRMAAPRICVAGVDTETLEHVRPITQAGDPITRRLLRAEGGPFAIGAVVDLGAVTHHPATPEYEDHKFKTSRAHHVTDLEGVEFLSLLEDVSCASVEDGFGPDLERLGLKCAVEVGRGDRSLAVVRARRAVLEIEARYGRLQLRLDNPGPRTYLPVTDIRFYEPDHATIRRDVVDDVARRLRKGVGVYLMLGLARAYRARTDDRLRHWLQLNGLCLADRAVGDLP